MTVQEMEQLWLTSVCESPNDRGDGFGLAVPGVWRYAEGEEELCKQDPCSFTR